MSVSGCIHPFISCHCQDSYLIDLANSKTGNPDTMKQCHQQNEQNLKKAFSNNLITCNIKNTQGAHTAADLRVRKYPSSLSEGQAEDR